MGAQVSFHGSGGGEAESGRRTRLGAPTCFFPDGHPCSCLGETSPRQRSRGHADASLRHVSSRAAPHQPPWSIGRHRLSWALFAREIGLPCVSGLANILETMPADADALVDADAAEVVINPNQEQKASFRARRERQERARVPAQSRSHEPAVTRDGTVVSVLANVGCKDDTVLAIENGAEGVGLYRIEQAYMGRQEPPDTAALLEEMRRVLELAKGLPVCVRLLDVGADKPLPFIESSNEANPALGVRHPLFAEISGSFANTTGCAVAAFL